MSPKRPEEVLYETEAALRLVDHELHGLRGDEPEPTPEPADAPTPGGLAELPMILERANAQILGVLRRLRESRAAIESTALQKLAATHDKIREVTSATEDAAINIMDACDRATQVVDQLDAIDADETPDREKAAELRGTLRDELFLMMGALQFQDITAQQLAHASSVLVEMEQRLVEVAKLFDPNAAIGDEAAVSSHDAPDESTFDPNATTKNPEERQSLADEIFSAVKPSAA